MTTPLEGILPVNKPSGQTAFTLVRQLRRLLGVKKIGHAGTLDPFATGVMVMLIGRNYTKLSDKLLNQDKEYLGRIHLGIETDSYDCDGKEVNCSDHVPTREEIEDVLQKFQGEVNQTPPMFSAKKVNGKKLYELARKGEIIERRSVKVHMETEMLSYEYPYIDIQVKCSKGTYIRSIAHDIGQLLGCGAHLSTLTRTQSGTYQLADCLDGKLLDSSELNLNELSSKMKTLTNHS